MAVRLDVPTAKMQAWAKSCRASMREGGKAALTRTAARVRQDINENTPRIFAHTVPLTQRATLYTPATAGTGANTLVATVFVRDDAGKGTPPAKYLGPEILGGGRAYKRSERVLQRKGMLELGQYVVPAAGQPHFMPGSQVTQILSRLKAFGEQGFAANANDSTTAKLRRQARAAAAARSRKEGGSPSDIKAARDAAFAPIARKTGTNYFLAHDKRSKEPLAIYRLIAPGEVEPIFWFVHRAPSYRPRFHFFELATDLAAEHWPKLLAEALQEAIGRRL